MPLVNMNDMLRHAHSNGYAIGAFDLVSLDFLDAILQGAENCRAPVILSLAESHFDYFDFDMIMPSVVDAARRSRIPVAIHLDHGESLETAIRGIGLGCNGVMIDTSNAPLQDNIAFTRQIVEMARGCGVPVEGELGYVPGVEGEDAERHPGEIAYTTVEEAKRFVEETGVDFLAVSIGTVHGRMQGQPKLDLDRLQAIDNALNIPLVIHGGTGLSDEQFRQLIERGVSKINYYTALADAAGAAIAQQVQQGVQGYTAMVSGVTEAIRLEVERCIRLWGSADRSEAILAMATVWEPVEHVIIYDVEGLDEQQTRQMMAEGRRVLSRIPGVLEVITGATTKDGVEYPYCWLVKFCHPSVIDSYRDHPDHVAFADNHFRPVAGKRISIDYQDVTND